MNSLFQSQVFCHAQVVKDELLIWNLSECSFKNKSIVIIMKPILDILCLKIYTQKLNSFVICIANGHS